MKLNQLSPLFGSKKAPTRKGKGIGSTIGKTSGRGHKGQKARSGGARRDFEGGQLPLYQRLPKRGFKSLNKNKPVSINLERITYALRNSKFDPKKVIDADLLHEIGLIQNKKDSLVKLIGNQKLNQVLNFKLHLASAGAIKAVSEAGGKVELIQKALKPKTKAAEVSLSETKTK